MKQLVNTVLSASLVASVSIGSIPGRADSSTPAQAPPDRGRFVMPFGFDLNTGDRVLSFEDEFGDDEDAFSGQSTQDAQHIDRVDTEKAWLLEPGTFKLLSAAGQRAALRMNGLLRRPHRRNQIVVPPGDVSIEATPGDNIRVNNPALDTNFHTHSETSIAVNGNTLIESFNEFEFNGYGLSTDGGNTWSHKRTPDPPGGINFGDGVVAFGPSGECYYASLVLRNSNNNLYIGVAKSTDNGATFSTPVDASTTQGNSNDTQDKEWIAVDRNSNSPFKGNVYVSWSDFTQSNGSFIAFARSTNGGTTWDAPMALSPQDGTRAVQGSVPVVAPNGDLYVAFSDGHPSIGGIGYVRSTDGGKTFLAERRAATVSSIGAMTGGGSVRTNSFPSMTVDRNNTIHIVYNAFGGSPLDRSDIFYVRSTDNGLTFSAPLKLNDDNTTSAQFFPSVAATSDGTLGVKWWDRRNDPINDSLTDVYMTISKDGGTSFGKNFRITNHNWLFGPIEIGFNGGYHGDYDGMAADAANFYLSWSDERNGEADAYFSQISAGRDPNAPDFNISTMKTLDSVIAGNNATFDFNTSATNGFAGTLNLSASPSISGLTYNFTNASVNPGDVAHLTVSTSQGVQPGASLITAAATAGGVTRKTNIRLNVLSPTRFAGSPVNVSRTKGFTSLQAGIRVEPGGTVHVAFDDDSSNVRGNDVFYTRSADGRTYSAPIKLSDNAQTATQSTLAIDAGGNPYVAWTNVISTQQSTILLSKSMDRGNTFSSPVIASGSSTRAQNPKIAVDKNGNILLTYIDPGTSGSPVFGARSTDGGTTFSVPFRISQPGEIINNPPFVAVDSVGAGYVVYTDRSQSVIAVKIAVAPDGQSYAAPRVISDSQVSAFAPQIAIDKSDNVFVTFYDLFAPTPSTSNREIVVIKSTDHGATFGPQVNVSNNVGQSFFPSLILGDQGRVSVAWEDTTEDPQRDVMVARSTDGGATWGLPINLSVDPGRSFGAFGDADGNGNLFIAWTDDSPANTDVFVASLSPSALGPPDFSMGTSSAALTVQRGTRVNIPVTINRIAGFSGNVAVTPPDLAGLKAKGIDFSQTSSGGVLSFKLKFTGVTGLQYLTFTGKDDSGRTRLAVLVMIIQPAT